MTVFFHVGFFVSDSVYSLNIASLVPVGAGSIGPHVCHNVCIKFSDIWDRMRGYFRAQKVVGCSFCVW